MTDRTAISCTAAVLLAMSVSPVSLALHAFHDPLLRTTAGSPYGISFRGSVGLLQGDVGEYVYVPEANDHKLSELQWDLSGIVMGGAIFSGVAGRFGLNAGLWTTLSKGNGEMKDYDWGVQGMDWTDYSRSEVEIDGAYSFDFNANCLVFGHPYFGLRVMVGYKRDFWSWTDSAQEYIYSVNGYRDRRGHFGGRNLINYEQTFDIPYGGLNLDGAFASVAWNAYLLYSPFVRAEDLDHHVQRNLHYLGNFSGGDFFAVGAVGTRRLTRHLFLQGSFEYQDIPEFRGDYYIQEPAVTGKNGAAVSNSHMSFSLALGWQL